MDLNPASTGSRCSLEAKIRGLHRCQTCPKLFPTRGTLNRHRKTHTLPYRCNESNECKKGFASRTDLDRHKHSIHIRTDMVVEFNCQWPRCHRERFSRRDNLLKHMNDFHVRRVKKRGGLGMESHKAELLYKVFSKRPKQSLEDTTSLLLAAHDGDCIIVQRLLDGGVDTELKADLGKTALHVAAANGHEKLVRLLVKRGADSNAKDDSNISVLLHAAFHGHETVVRLLLDHGTHTEIKWFFDSSPFSRSVFSNEAVVQLLIEHGVNLNINYVGQYGSALQEASFWGSEKVVRLLLEQGADINMQGGVYGSALQAAIAISNKKLVQLLLDHGADITTGCLSESANQKWPPLEKKLSIWKLLEDILSERLLRQRFLSGTDDFPLNTVLTKKVFDH